MKNQNSCFNIYIIPKQPIDASASSVTGLTRIGRQLFLNGTEISSASRKFSFLKTLEFLRSLGKKVILIAHNCKFDYNHFIHAAKELSLIDELSEIILGFCDSIPLFEEALPNRQNKFNLSDLGKDLLNTSMSAAHNAMFDKDILEMLCIKYIDFNNFIKTKLTINKIIENTDIDNKRKEIEKTFDPLFEDKIISKGIIKRLSNNNISWDDILNTYKEKGEKHCITYLKAEIDGKSIIIKTKKILSNIIEYVKKCIK